MEAPDRSVELLARDIFSTHGALALQMSDDILANALAIFTPDELKLVPALSEPIIRGGEIFMSPQFVKTFMTFPTDEHLSSFYGECGIPKQERRIIMAADEPTDAVAQRMRIAYPDAPKGKVFYAINAEQFAHIMGTRPRCPRTAKLREICNKIRKMNEVREYIRALSSAPASAAASPQPVTEKPSIIAPTASRSFARGVVYVTTTQEDAGRNMFSIHATNDMSILDLNYGAPMRPDTPDILCIRYEVSRADLVATTIREALAPCRIVCSADSSRDRFKIHLSYLARFVRAILEGFIFANSIIREYDDMRGLLPPSDPIPITTSETTLIGKQSAMDAISDDESEDGSDAESHSESDSNSDTDSDSAPVSEASSAAASATIPIDTPASDQSCDGRAYQIIDRWILKNVIELNEDESHLQIKISSLWCSFQHNDSFTEMKKLAPTFDIEKFRKHVGGMSKFRDRLVRKPKDKSVIAISGFMLRKK